MSDDLLKISELKSFYEEWGDEVCTYLQILTGNAEEADDLLQTAFLKLIEQVKKDRIKKITAPAYLKTIARNEFYQRFRHNKHERPLDDCQEPAADEERSVIEDNSNEIRLTFLEALSSPQLPEEIASILRLRFLRDLEIVEICRETGRSRATVYRMMEKGMNFLAGFFENAGLGVDSIYR